MRNLLVIAAILFSSLSFSAGTDSTIIGEWRLFKIIDNMTGNEFYPNHKSDTSFVFWIRFDGENVNFNFEYNNCSNSYEITGKNEIEFKYYDTCTLICCDGEFSELLTYAECTGYFIKNINTLVLVSEDRIFYFSRRI